MIAKATPAGPYAALARENEMFRREIRIAHQAAKITADLVVKQFEETERVLRRLQIANAQRKAVLNSAAQISIIATDEQGTVIVFNTGAENLLGYRAAEVIGRENPTRFHLDAELLSRGRELGAELGRPLAEFQVLAEHALSGRSRQQEWTYLRRDGSQVPVSMSVNVLKDPDDVVTGFLFTAIDISEKKRSEEALKESEKKYRLLVNNLPNTVFRGHADGSIDFFDDKIEQLTGYTKEQFLSREMTWHDLVHQEDYAYAREVFLKALKEDKPYIREYRFRAKNGGIIWVQEGGQIVCDESGKIDFITGAFLDITERKLAEKAVHESEEKYRSLFDSGPNPIFVLDRRTLEILDANPSARETYGYALPELAGRSFLELGSLEYEGGGAEGWPEALVESQKVRHFRKGRHPFYVNFKTCPARYKGREAIILAVTDVTEMMEKDAQLIQASKMTTLGEMSAGIAHELNQPLNAIKMGNEYLKMMVEEHREIPPDTLHQICREVSAQVDRASDIINRLRAFGRKSDFRKEAVDINLPIRNVLGIVGHPLGLQNIRLRTRLRPDLPQIVGQSNRLEQVFFNLITNARDAILQKKESLADRLHGVIAIRTSLEAGEVVVTVSDNGSGIPRTHREKIFEPFFTTKEVGRGLGLGLSITYRIVRDFGGTIDLRSQEGVGTTVRLAFPQLPGPATADPGPSPASCAEP